MSGKEKYSRVRFSAFSRDCRDSSKSHNVTRSLTKFTGSRHGSNEPPPPGKVFVSKQFVRSPKTSLKSKRRKFLTQLRDFSFNDSRLNDFQSRVFFFFFSQTVY